MAKITIPCRRYYYDEMPEGDFSKFVKNLYQFTDIKIQYYNALYDQKYKPEQSEDQLKGRNLTSWSKQTFHISDYYIAAINQATSGQLSAQKELNKLYINDKKKEIAEIDSKIHEISEELDKKHKVKEAILSYYKTGSFEKPYPRCSIRIINGWLSGYKIAPQPVEVYERKVESHIRRLKHQIKMLQQRVRKKQSKLEHLKNDIPKRILFGSKSAYRKKDDPKHTGWKEEFMEKRYSTIVFPGRHTSKFGNFLVKYQIHTECLTIRMMDNTEVTFPHFHLPRYEREYLANFTASPQERSAIGYQFLLKKDQKGHPYILPQVVLTFQEDTHINHGFSNGCISMDLNVDHIALTDISESGTLIQTYILPFDLTDKTTGQTKNIIGNVMTKVGKICKEQKKPLCMEDLDFRRKKAGVHYKNKQQNKQLSSFAYRKFMESAVTQGRKFAFAVYKTDPSYTSFIGKVKYMRKYGISIHTSAAYVIGMRSMAETSEKFSWYEQIPTQYLIHVNTTDPIKKQWQILYKKLKNIPAHCFYTMKND